MALMPMKAPEEASASPPEWATIEQVFAALESPLLAYARRLRGDFAVAEDVVQDAFMKLHTQFKKVLTPQPWLYRTVHNLAVDHQRRSNRTRPMPSHRAICSSGIGCESAMSLAGASSSFESPMRTMRFERR